MGLDQYVGVKRHISSWRAKYEEVLMQDAICKTLGAEGLKVNGVEFELQYFRKANWIHGWFAQHAPEDWHGESFDVPRENIQELRKICAEILEKRDDELSAELLPGMQGFFFGDSNVDSYFYETVQQMYDAINKIESLKDFEDWYYTYSASW